MAATTTNSELEMQDIMSLNSKVNNWKCNQDDHDYNHPAVLNKQVTQSIHAVMREHRSLSVGCLPSDIKSYILKNSQNDYFKGDDNRKESCGIAETLN